MKLTWLAGWLCAALALGLVFWLLPDGGMKGGNAAKGNGPQVTKPYPRERDAREARTKNPRDQFEAARKRGLTEEEVRGIVEEYVQLGISIIENNDPTGLKLLDRRRRQQAWYLRILAEGFGLSDAQSAEAETKLGKALEHDFTALQKAIESNVHLIIYHGGEGAFPPDQFPPEINAAERMYSPSLWIGSEEVRPWSICELDEAQKDIVRFKNEEGLWEWLPWGDSTHDFVAVERYDDLDASLGGRTSITFPSGFLFPLGREQVDHIRASCIAGWDLRMREVSKTLVLDQVKFLTSAQLKTLLLFNPDVAAHLLTEMERGLDK